MDHSYSGSDLEKAKVLEQQRRVKGFEASQDQILGEGCYADPQSQAIYKGRILPYAVQQPWMLRKGFKKEEEEFNHILRSDMAQENPLVTFFKD